jgi:polyisoprenoid-binding protein YceI
LHFLILPGESEARFTVAERLAGRELTNVQGTTREVTGEINSREDGTLIASPSVVRVDLRTLKTGLDQRDAFIRGVRGLATEAFPIAEFILTRVEGVPVPYRDGTEVRLRLTGILRIRGLERETTWEGPFKREQGKLIGTATTVLTFSEVGLTPPDILNFVRVYDPLTLQVRLVARQTSD